MKFHKFFSLKRFGRLLSADLRLNSKRYVNIILGTAVGIYLLMFFSILLFNSQKSVGMDYFFGMFNLSLYALCAYIGSAFPVFSEKTTTSNFLLFPASHFEKLLSQFLLYFVAGIIVLAFLFWVDAHLLRLTTSKWESVSIESFSYGSLLNWVNCSHMFSIKTPDFSSIIFYMIMMVSIAGFLFTTRLFFKRFALAKSIISWVALFILTVLLMILFSHLFFPASTIGFKIEVPIYESLWGSTNWVLLTGSIFAIILVFFLPLAYFKLKEKQV